MRQPGEAGAPAMCPAAAVSLSALHPDRNPLQPVLQQTPAAQPAVHVLLSVHPELEL